MKVGVLTSTRADFGIYIPLLRELKADDYFNTEIIAFGTHLSEKFGYTIEEIENSGFSVNHKIETIPADDSPLEVTISVGETIKKFAVFWEKEKFDLVICLGDRYEMFAAVTAGSPFNVKFAHIHAGETTLGAIDNAYRHSITLMSEYAFVSTEEYKKRAEEIINIPENVFNTGALSVDNLMNKEFMTVDELNEKFDFDISLPTILSTFHPETVAFEKNEVYTDELVKAFDELSMKYQILITMPNADTMGLMIREKLIKLGERNNKVILRESLGMKGYLSCMKNCSFMLGNTSSGFVEAAFFPKWVVNVGDRQNGRIRTTNIVDCIPEYESILNAVEEIENRTIDKDCNVYGKGNTAKEIVTILKKL